MVLHHKTGVGYTEFEAYAQQPRNAERLLELINGEIVEKVPTEEHGEVVLNVAGALRPFVRAHKFGKVSTEALHRIPGDDKNAVLPDVSFRSGQNLPSVRQGAVSTMPDLAVEVQSPSQSDAFMAEKAAYYLANGTRMVWLVFPGKRTVEVHQPGQNVIVLTADDSLDGGAVLPGFSLPVSEVFRLD
jgi:Uma2 family endonuclease